MPKDGIKEKHESFGMLQISRVSGGHKNLYGSSIAHSNTIRISLHEGTKERGLNSDWYYAGRQLFEVEMSPTQFAEAITSLNHGSGTPVTIRRVMGKPMENCPEENKRQLFEKEFSDRMATMANRLKQVTERAEEILKGSKAPTKTEKQEILNAIRALHAEVGSNIPFVQSCFNEQMDKTVLEAKGEVEAFVQHKITQLGLQSLEQLTGLQPPDRRRDVMQEIGSNETINLQGDEQ